MGHYSLEERHEAIEQAKRLEASGEVFCVKVVKEIFDPEDNTTEVTTIFRSTIAPGDDAEDLFGARRKRLQGRAQTKSNKYNTKNKQLLNVFCRILRSMFLFQIFSMFEKKEILPKTSLHKQRKRVSQNRPTNPAARHQDNITSKKIPPWLEQKQTIDRFFSDVMEYINAINHSSDNVVRFGLCFFVCGACEALSKQLTLSQEDSIDFVAASLSILRLPKQRSRQFAERCENYLAESVRYMEMFQAGHNAMVAFVRDSVSSASSLRAALKRWNERKDRKQGEARRSLTMMFTDIVGASAMAAERGDDHAMKVLRVHNQIVETVLAQFGGIHVKNTGDGVLAAFEEAKMAVKAGCVIQRCIKEHNASFPSLDLQLRIGLNVGEAIAESGDFFGATVNLASRVCAAAGPHQLLCTGIVRRRAEGLGIPFVPRGQYRMKGYPDPIPLFEAVWDEQRVTEPGKPAAERVFDEGPPKAVKVAASTVEA
jgi:class 3 adenylate cyclase